jgi:hypothetical protein
MPELSRPSLRALARECRVSHQLLHYFLDGLKIWQEKEYHRSVVSESDRMTAEILARADDEKRFMTPWEDQQVHGYHVARIRALAGSALLDKLASIKRAAKRGPLPSWDVKMLKILVRAGFPDARELLLKALQSNAKNNLPPILSETRKSFGSVKGVAGNSAKPERRGMAACA